MEEDPLVYLDEEEEKLNSNSSSKQGEASACNGGQPPQD